jgi:hypothetical protein
MAEMVIMAPHTLAAATATAATTASSTALSKRIASHSERSGCEHDGGERNPEGLLGLRDHCRLLVSRANSLIDDRILRCKLSSAL